VIRITPSALSPVDFVHHGPDEKLTAHAQIHVLADAALQADFLPLARRPAARASTARDRGT